MIKPKFVLDLKSGKLWKKRDGGQKGPELRVINWKNLRKGLCLWIPLDHTPILGDKAAPPSSGRTPLMSDLRLASRQKRMGVREPFLYLLFLRFFQLKIIISFKVAYFGVTYPDSLHLLMMLPVS